MASQPRESAAAGVDGSQPLGCGLQPCAAPCHVRRTASRHQCLAPRPAATRHPGLSYSAPPRTYPIDELCVALVSYIFFGPSQYVTPDDYAIISRTVSAIAPTSACARTSAKQAACAAEAISMTSQRLHSRYNPGACLATRQWPSGVGARNLEQWAQQVRDRRLKFSYFDYGTLCNRTRWLPGGFCATRAPVRNTRGSQLQQAIGQRRALSLEVSCCPCVVPRHRKVVPAAPCLATRSQVEGSGRPHCERRATRRSTAPLTRPSTVGTCTLMHVYSGARGAAGIAQLMQAPSPGSRHQTLPFRCQQRLCEYQDAPRAGCEHLRSCCAQHAPHHPLRADLAQVTAPQAMYLGEGHATTAWALASAASPPAASWPPAALGSHSILLKARMLPGQNPAPHNRMRYPPPALCLSLTALPLQNTRHCARS